MTLSHQERRCEAQYLHDGTSQEQHQTPFTDEKHLTFDVKGLVEILQRKGKCKILTYISLYLKVFKLEILGAFFVAASIVGSQFVDFILSCEFKHRVQTSLNDLDETRVKSTSPVQ